MDPLLINLPLPIETEHLLIRAPQPGDGAPMHAAYLEARARLLRWFRWAQSEDTPEEYEVYSRQSLGKTLAREQFEFMLIEKASGNLAGRAGLAIRCQEPFVLEIGYWLCNGYEGRGYISECVQALLRLSFHDLGAVRVILRADAENLRSQAVAWRNGFQYEGTMRHFEPQHNDRTRLIDMCFFGILAEEFPREGIQPLPSLPPAKLPRERETPVMMDDVYKRWLTLYDVPETLRTERLLMRACRDDDAGPVYAAISAAGERLGRYLRFAHEMDGPEKALSWLRRNQAGFAKREEFTYVLLEPESGRFLGCADMGMEHLNGAVFEIGYWLADDALGNGYAAEAVRALVELAFAQLQSTRVEIVAQADNLPSRAVAERLGFAFELIMRQQGRDARSPAAVDLAFYSLVRPEFEARRAEFAVLR